MEPVKRNVTTGMIAAYEPPELARYVRECERRLYVKIALRMLRACDARFANWNPDEGSIIGGDTFPYHDPDGGDTEVPIIYGDYHFIETILRLKGKSLFL